MIRVDVSEAANADLDAIFDYGAALFGPAVAETYLRRFQSAYDLIGDHPQIGAVHDAVRPPIRSVPCGSHRVYYDVLADHVMVRRILHKAMNVEQHL